MSDIENIFEFQQRYPARYDLTKLFCVSIFVAHYFACIFWKIGDLQLQYDVQDTWLHQQNLINSFENKHFFDIYLNSFYFAIITMSTVGYGDIHPVNQLEKVSCIILTLLSCLVFAYAVNTIGTIFRDIEITKSTLKKEIYQVSKFMNQRNVTKQCQTQVIKALEQYHCQKQNGLFNGKQILSQIPQIIQDDVFNEYFGTILSQSRFYKEGNFSKVFLERATVKMKEYICGEGTKMFIQGKKEDKLQILVEGDVQFIQENLNHKNKEYSVLKFKSATQDLNLQQFYTQSPNQFTMISTSLVRVIYIEYQEVTKILKDLPLDNEKFTNIKDNYLYNRTSLKDSCYICGSSVHNTFQCNYVHHNKNDLHVIYNYLKPEKNRRIMYKRRCNIVVTNPRIHTLTQIKEIRLQLKEVRINIVRKIIKSFQVPENLDQQMDIEFFYLFPKIILLQNKQLACEDVIDLEDEQYFAEELQRLEEEAEEQLQELNEIKEENENENDEEDEEEQISQKYINQKNNAEDNQNDNSIKSNKSNDSQDNLQISAINFDENYQNNQQQERKKKIRQSSLFLKQDNETIQQQIKNMQRRQSTQNELVYKKQKSPQKDPRINQVRQMKHKLSILKTMPQSQIMSMSQQQKRKSSIDELSLILPNINNTEQFNQLTQKQQLQLLNQQQIQNQQIQTQQNQKRFDRLNSSQRFIQLSEQNIQQKLPNFGYFQDQKFNLNNQSALYFDDKESHFSGLEMDKLKVYNIYQNIYNCEEVVKRYQFYQTDLSDSFIINNVNQQQRRKRNNNIKTQKSFINITRKSQFQNGKQVKQNLNGKKNNKHKFKK